MDEPRNDPASIERSNAAVLKPVDAFCFVKDFLQKESAVYRNLCEIREKGWENPDGDKYFERQRNKADYADQSTAQYFYEMMQNIGREMQESTGALRIASAKPLHGSILDFCMAPGGFLRVVLSHNPGSKARAFTLPPSQGGHPTLLEENVPVTIEALDINLLAVDMGVRLEDIPADHPEANQFLSRRLAPNQGFDIVICDGQVLRTHSRAEYRQESEPQRLTAVQLALGIEHVRPGGTMIVLLHRLEAWDTVRLLSRFSKFSRVVLFKPRIHHAKRSSFYLNAMDIQPSHPEAQALQEDLKLQWKQAMFDSMGGKMEKPLVSDKIVKQVLDQFGRELIRLGDPIWKTQADALARAPFIRQHSSKRY